MFIFHIYIFISFIEFEIYVVLFRYAFSSISLSASSSDSGTDCRQISYSWRMSSSAWRCSSFCSYGRLKLLRIVALCVCVVFWCPLLSCVVSCSTPRILTIISFSWCCGTALWYCSSDAVSSICNSVWSRTSKLLCNVSSKSGKVDGCCVFHQKSGSQ